MSLLDALLLDPPPFDVWIALPLVPSVRRAIHTSNGGGSSNRASSSDMAVYPFLSSGGLLPELSSGRGQGGGVRCAPAPGREPGMDRLRVRGLENIFLIIP